MTRKRFVKLMMADGYSRNDALEIARRVQGDGSYAQTYTALHLLKTTPSLQETVDRLVEHCTCAMRAFVDALGAFTQTFRERMESYSKKEGSDDGVSKG